MRQISWRLLTGLLGLGLFSSQALAQHEPDWPDWAYGLLDPLSSDSRVGPPCPDGSRPIDCAYIGTPVPDDGIKRSLPDTDLTFTRNEAYYNYGPADWYPGDHPEMPDIVAHGKEEAGLRACALCHYPNGQGKMENGHVAGLTETYFLQQLEAFATGMRRSADPRKANTNEMAMIAAGLTDEERREIAAYYSSIPFKKMVRVVESEEAPQVRTTSNGLMLPIEDAPHVPLGMRVVEVPEDPERTELSRDPRGMWITYAPPGSLAAGEALVTTGAGKTVGCAACHGPGMTGLADFPSIAGRTASYTMRQLWDIKQGTRQSAIMAPVVAQLTAEDMLYISVYLASLEP
jgi:cytochrome c553